MKPTNNKYLTRRFGYISVGYISDMAKNFTRQAREHGYLRIYDKKRRK